MNIQQMNDRENVIAKRMSGFLLVMACLGASSAWSAEWFVDAVNGVDAAGRGASAETAFKTVQSAVDAAASGDTVTLLPGDYTEGFTKLPWVSGCTSRARVVIDKPLTLRSQQGRATRDTTRILGAWDSTGSSEYPDGMGPEAVRCVWVTADGAGSRFEGITFAQGAAPYYTWDGAGHACGGGICVADGKGVAIVDCAFRACQATRGGGVFSNDGNGPIVVARTLFKQCRATKFGQAARGATLYNCVLDDNDVTRLADGTPKGDNTKDQAAATAYAARIVNCTVVNNHNRGIGCDKSDYGGDGVYNCLALNNGGDAVSCENVYNLVSDRSGLTMNNSVALGGISESAEVYDTRAEDYRLILNARSKTTGSTAWLEKIPEEFRATDYYGNPRTTDGVVYCGAVQAACTNETSGLSIGRSYDGGAFFLDGKPVDCVFRMIVQRPGPCAALNLKYEPIQGNHLLHYKVGDSVQWPKTDGSAWLTPDMGTVQTVAAVTAQTAFWVDAAQGADETGDGSTDSPWKTLQKAVDEVVAQGKDAVVYAKAGDYAEGGAVLYEHNSRVAVPNTYTKTLRVLAVDGPTETYISGAADPGSAASGIGDNACRCLAVGTWTGAAAFQGFTLRNGYTGHDDDGNRTRGGCLINYNGTAVLLDCVVRDCVGGRGGVAYGGSFYRCRIADCRIINAGLFRKTKLYASVITGTIPTDLPILCEGACIYNCTLARNNNSAIASASNTGGKGYAYNCVLADRLPAFSQTIGAVLDDDQVLYSLYDRAAVGNVFSTSEQQDPVPFRDSASGDWSLLDNSSGQTLASTDYWTTPMDINGDPYLPNGEGRYPAGAFSTAAAGTTLYADAANGSDENDGHSEETAVRTLKAALEKAKGGDTVLVLPGIYKEGTMLQTRAQSGGDDATLPARAVVPSYVTLASRDGAEVTIIEGAPDTTSEATAGCGPNAVRCVFLARQATLRGFTLRNGCTDRQDDAANVNTRGGGVHAYGGTIDEEFDALAENCVITNCTAVRGGGGYFGTYRNCLFLGNALCSSKPGLAVCRARAEGCFFAGNGDAGAHSTLYQCDVRNCTIMGGQAQANGVTCVETEPYLAARAVVNSVVIAEKVGGALFANTIFGGFREYAYKGTISSVNCIERSEQEIALDAEGRPTRTSCAIDAGDLAETSEALLAAGDLSGNARVSNAKLDVGAYEYDWRGDYAKALARRNLLVSSADSAVTLVDAGVSLPSGAELVVDWTLQHDGVPTFTVVLTGTGVLTLKCGETAMVFTASGTYRIPGAERENHFAFGYTGDGVAILSDFRQPIGFHILVR